MEKVKTSAFVEYVLSKVGCPYLWGGQGETLYEIITKYAKTKNQSDSATKNMIKFMGIKDFQFFDCSGLGVDFLMKHGILSYDTTADGLYRKCDKISKAEAVPGDFVFLLDKSGKATHIGYVVDNGYVVHALDQKVGVIKEKLSARKWVYGRPNFAFEFEIKTEVETETVEYFQKYTGKSGSIVDGLNAVGANSNFTYREKIAKMNNIKQYEGTEKQNTTLLTLLKQGKLLKP